MVGGPSSSLVEFMELGVCVCVCLRNTLINTVVAISQRA